MNTKVRDWAINLLLIEGATIYAVGPAPGNLLNGLYYALAIGVVSELDQFMGKQEDLLLLRRVLRIALLSFALLLICLVFLGVELSSWLVLSVIGIGLYFSDVVFRHLERHGRRTTN